jgi:tRNA (guanine-N7-)-methyltransferase
MSDVGLNWSASAFFKAGQLRMTSQKEHLMLHLEEGEDDPVLDWPAVFGNGLPVELEIGIGKGRFLIDAAQTQEQHNFIGIEWAAKYLRLAHERAVKRGLENLRFFRGDAREFVEQCVGSLSLAAIHIYFPDPWPKTRHHKRRLFNREFLGEIERVLVPGGRLWLATDHGDYFSAMEKVLDSSPCLSRVEGVEWHGAKTNYEIKYLDQGKPINRLVLDKDA